MVEVGGNTTTVSFQVSYSRPLSDVHILLSWIEMDSIVSWRLMTFMRWIGYRYLLLLYVTTIQCVSVDSTSFVIYPELEATEVRFSALKRYLCSFYFRIDNETGHIQ